MASMGGIESVLVLGASGLLGTEVCKVLAEREIPFVCSTSRESTKTETEFYLDIRCEESIRSCVQRSAATHIVNCSAYTAVDSAESDYAAAFALNSDGVASLARVCAELGVFLVHVSTDYVFGAVELRRPLCESDRVAPLGIYGLSKWYGEEFARLYCSESLIVRTSWLHGLNGANFIDTMLRLGSERPEVRVVQDQVGSLTWAPWLANRLIDLLASGASGLVHASSRGEVSWYDVTVELFKQAGIASSIVPVSTEEFPRPAPRPPYSALNTDRLYDLIDIDAFTWKDSIAAHLAAKETAK